MPIKDDNANTVSSESSISEEPVIWDTRSVLREHPLLQVVFDLTKENVAYRLSKSFAIVDSENTMDHERVLLTLPGRFGLKDLEGSWGTTVAHTGIMFNKALVEQSTRYVQDILRKEGDAAIDRLHDDFNVITFIAILQETLEHELGHWKYHVEGVKDDNAGLSDKGMEREVPAKLRNEAGFAAQQKIRQDYFAKENKTGECRLLDLDNPKGELPLRPVFAFLYDDYVPGEPDLDLDEDPLILNKKEIFKHMDYPKSTSSGRDVESKKKRKRWCTNGSSIDNPKEKPEEGNDVIEASSSGRIPRPWQESIKAFLPSSIESARTLWEDKSIITKDSPKKEGKTESKNDAQTSSSSSS